MNANRSIRLACLALLGTSALYLSACSSAVKLDDAASKGAAPITNAAVANSSGTGNNNVAATTVAPVVVSPDANADANAQNRVVYFDFDSFLVKDESRSVVESQAKRLSAAKSTKVTIEGHTDERGGSEYNLALGQKRAAAVQKSLTLLGVSADQIEAVSFGKERPAVSGSSDEAMAKNRRAEIKDR